MGEANTRSNSRERLPLDAGSPGHRALLIGGALAPVIFVGAFLIQGAVRSGYQPLQDTISALMNGNAGWQQRANFFLFGTLVIGFALGLRIALTPGIGATWVPRVKALEGLCLMAAGIFPDPVHTLVTIASFTLALIAYAILARRFWDDGRRGWVAYSAVTGAASVACLATFGALGGGHALGSPAGLFEKLAAGVNGLYTSMLAVYLLRSVKGEE